MPHEPSRLLVAGDLHADESWFENLVYYAREQRCQAILQLGDLGYWPRIKHYDDFLRSLPRQLEGADLDLYFVEGNHEDLDALFDTDFAQVRPFRQIEERVYHLPRGAQWRWHGLRFVSVGGGYSLDKKLRIPGYDWFERETLSEGESTRSSRSEARSTFSSRTTARRGSRSSSACSRSPPRSRTGEHSPRSSSGCGRRSFCTATSTARTGRSGRTRRAASAAS